MPHTLQEEAGQKLELHCEDKFPPLRFIIQLLDKSLY